MTDNVDQVARDLASRSLASIDRHEAVCTERWNELRRILVDPEGPLGKAKKDIATLNNRMWHGLVTVGTMLLGGSAWMAAKLLHLI